MSALEAAILGILQGLTEFIPVSSSGHLALAQYFMGMEDNQANVFFIVILHVASLAAVLVYFWADFLKLFTSRRSELVSIVVATIPAAVLGWLFKDTIEASFSNPVLICFCLILTGAFLHISSRLAREKVALQDAGWMRALWVGLAQALALLPGLSRSGWTIGTGILTGIRREEAVRFSFFMGSVAILGASLVKFKDISLSEVNLPLLPIIIGIVVTFLFSLLAIRIVMFLVQQFRIGWFAFYCGVVGWILLVLFSTGVIG